MEQKTNDLEAMKNKPTSLKDFVVGAVFASVIAVDCLTGIAIGHNMYKNHDINYRVKDKIVQRKMDGAFTNTKVEKFDDGRIWMWRGDVLTPIQDTTYYDANSDGKVDAVTLWENPSGKDSVPVRYERHTDFDKYRNIFDAADADFKAQLERFSKE